MVITHYGIESFKVQFGDTILAFNPTSKEALKGSAKPVRFGADIAFVTLRDPAFAGVENLSMKGREPFVVAGPGEYEIKEVFIKAYPSKSSFGVKDGTESRINTVYSAKLEGIHMVFLGALGNPEIDPVIYEDLEEVDILFVPIGGDGVLAPHEAYQLAVNIGAKVIIPMHYSGEGAQKDALETFLKESGNEKPEKIEKLTIKPRDLVGKSNEVIVLEAQN